MALSKFQVGIVRLLSEHRKSSGESYVAGGAALTSLMQSSRLSRDIDIFHDSREAVHRSFESDSQLLKASGYQIEVEVDRPGFVEVLVLQHQDQCRLQWAQDSAFRFFPLMEDDVLGLTLHPFDLATNKILALVGRTEPRDWIDTITCNDHLQPLGYLVWAAAGKDPGLSPTMILEQAARTARYSESEIAVVEFEGRRPSASELSQKWRAMLKDARQIVNLLPPNKYGACVYQGSANLVNLAPTELKVELELGTILFHEGSLYGAFPSVV